jgi:hypothetical protein
LETITGSLGRGLYPVFCDFVKAVLDKPGLLLASVIN